MSKIEEQQTIASEPLNFNFLKDCLEKLQYVTPKNIADFIKQNQVKLIIGNPPINQPTMSKIEEQGAVMRSASEVLSRLEEAEKELLSRNLWYEREKEKYDRDRRFWGLADDEIMREAFDALSETKNEIALLKWVLNLQ